ncbi:hypothetical protein [Paenibacillus amylolyticus]|uniref:hypothetical protein n=1 Tax=Paenibacillus amylolyticus TaxID=1451 RepID=UPI00249C0C3F|nr:hypothetical protein [Paenibacillus amylolyticus]WFA88045.1 hypothetical protein OGI70_14495 [Paenibacillus amylolyticus]
MRNELVGRKLIHSQISQNGVFEMNIKKNEVIDVKYGNLPDPQSTIIEEDIRS